MTDTHDPTHWHGLAEAARAGRLHMPRRPLVQFSPETVRAIGAMAAAVRNAATQMGQMMAGMAQQSGRVHTLQSRYWHQLAAAARRAAEIEARRTMSKRAFRRWRAKRRGQVVLHVNRWTSALDGRVRPHHLSGTRAHSIIMDDPEGGDL